MKYDCIEYRGKCRSYMIEILPSRKVVKIWKDHPYWFTENDSQDEDAIRYYKNMEKYGVVLCVVDGDKVEDTSRESSTPQETPEVEMTPAPEVEDTCEECVIPETIPEEQSIEEVSNDNEEAIVTDATEEELIEFLDLTYDEEEIKNVARDAGIKRIQSSWDKSTVISKILETNPQHVVNLMKNS